MAQVNSAQLGRRAGAHKGMVPVVVQCPANADCVNQHIFIADQKYRVYSIEAVWTVADTGETMQIQRLQGTEAIGSGDDLITAISFTAATNPVNTVVTATLTTTETDLELADGDRLALEFPEGANDTIAGLNVTIWLIPDGDKRYWISEG